MTLTNMGFFARARKHVIRAVQIKWHHFTFERYWTALFL